MCSLAEVPDAAERQLKLRLADAVTKLVKARKLSQADAAQVVVVTRPKVAVLGYHKLAGFSVERLMNLLTLDRDGRLSSCYASPRCAQHTERTTDAERQDG